MNRRSARSSARLFLAEGPLVVREALALPGCVIELFATPAATDRHRDLVASAESADVPWRVVDESSLSSISDSVAPQGLVGVCRFVDVPLREAVAGALELVAVCAEVRDPGNAGSVIRCADAVGADAVVLAGNSVDAYNPKTVRASAGSLFHVPIVIGSTVQAVAEVLGEAGVTLLAADGHGALSLDDAEAAGLLRAPTAWLFGNEARGLPGGHLALCEAVVRVPIYGRAESLNLATAAAVCLYATARSQRA